MTWSSITNRQKEKLKYDTSGAYSFRRADVNQMLKVFSNDTSPDPMIYLGKHSQDIILASFRTALCWMVGRGWDDLPMESQEMCSLTQMAVEQHVKDQFAIVSHSLGSRIVMDGMQSIARKLGKAEDGKFDQIKADFIANFQKKKDSLLPSLKILETELKRSEDF